MAYSEYEQVAAVCIFAVDRVRGSCGLSMYASPALHRAMKLGVTESKVC